MSGYDRMPLIVAKALPEVSAHLWSLYWIARNIRATRIFELGVRSGDSNRALRAAAMDIPGATVTSFDIDGDSYHVNDVTASYGIEPFDGTWTCIKSDSVKAAEMYGNGTVDLLFIDTLHSFQHTVQEIIAWMHTIRPGGIMAFHDVGLNEPGRDGVLPAMRACLRPEAWDMEIHLHCAPGDTGMGWATRRD